MIPRKCRESMIKLNKLRQNWAGARILILGFGKEGRDAFLFLRKLFPKKRIGIADRLKIKDLRFKNIKLHLGKNYLKALKNYDVIVKSPGVSPKEVLKSDFDTSDLKRRITSQTEIFFENCPGKIIGVTGTKGKSTTSSLIYEILKRKRIKAHLIGNIGRPVLNLLFSAAAKDVYVYELSSHQLAGLKKYPACNVLRSNAGRPHIAVLLNIYPEHMDYYRNFREYVRAKANITFHQTKNDYLIYNQDDRIVREIAKKSKAKKIPIKGDYYSLDRTAAKAVGKILKIPVQVISRAIENFRALPHRMELAGKFKGIVFYNDALATIPEATIMAMRELGVRVETVILGGSERNQDFKSLAKEILRSKIKTVILFPTTGKRIWQEISRLRGQGNPDSLKRFFVDNMRDAVKIAYQRTEKGKICLLSTASPSFSIFKDYKEKGNLFKKYVKQFAKNDDKKSPN